MDPSKLEKIAREVGRFSPQETDELERSKLSYEYNWARAAASVEQQLDAGEPLSRIILNWENGVSLASPKMNKVSGGVVQAVFREFGIEYEDSNDAMPYVRVGVVNGCYGLVLNIDPVDVIRRTVLKNVAHLVELGSGRGNNLFNVWLRLGKRGQKINYHALEFTNAGRWTTKLLASHPDAQDMKIGVHAFDFRTPDISMIPDDGRAVIFTLHAVEQVKFNGALYEAIARRKSPATVLHFEPVGWQRMDDIVQARRAGDENFLKAMIPRRLENILSPETQIRNQAINSWRMGYNTNLLETVRDAEAKGLCEVVNIHYDFTAWNPVNPMTFIQLAFPNAATAPPVLDRRNVPLGSKRKARR